MPLVNDMSVIFKIKLVRCVGTFVGRGTCLSEDMDKPWIVVAFLEISSKILSIIIELRSVVLLILIN